MMMVIMINLVMYLLRFETLQHLQLNGQSMTVPARHKAHPAALQQLMLDDKVLQDFVHGMTNVKIACEGEEQCKC